MKYGETVIDVLAGEIRILESCLKVERERADRLERENEDLRQQLEEVFRNQVIEPVFGEGEDGKL